MAEQHQIGVAPRPQQIGVENLHVADDANRQHRQQRHKQDDGAPLSPGHRRGCGMVGARHHIGRQITPPRQINAKAADHADARRGKAIVPAIDLAQRASDQRRRNRAATEDQRINLKGIGTPQIGRRIQAPHLRRHIALEHANAGDKAGQRQQKAGFERHQEMPAGHQQRAKGDRAGPPQPAIGNHAAGNRREIDKARIGAENRRSERGHRQGTAIKRFDASAKPGEPGNMFDMAGIEQRCRHVQHQQRLHPVKGETLKGFGESEIGKAARVAKKTVVRERDCSGGHANRCRRSNAGWQEVTATVLGVAAVASDRYPASMTQSAISIRGLEKTYAGGKRALKGIDLEIPRGSMFGLLGPNGAGKSTMINILAGLVNKTAGSATIWGFDITDHPRNAKASIGIVPQELVFDAFFTPFETLELQAGLFGVPKAKRRSMELLEAVRLADKAHVYSRTLSGGMKRRLLVAKALVHNPPVLVLDEPTAGVDIELRQQLWDYVRTLHAMGTTVVLTTHYLEEAEALCDRIAIVNNGEIVANDFTSVLLSTAGDKKLIVTVDRDLAEIPASLGDRVELKNDRVLTLTYDKRTRNAGQVLAAVAAAGLGVIDVSTQEADLEDVFLDLTRSRG